MAKEFAPSGTLTKTSIMLGCGETPDQVVQTMEKVRAAGVDVMTFGQYMRQMVVSFLLFEHFGCVLSLFCKRLFNQALKPFLTPA